MPRQPRTDWASTRKLVRCPQCGKLFRHQVFEQAGRPKVYHNSACRQAAYRQRRRDELDKMRRWFMDLLRAEQQKGNRLPLERVLIEMLRQSKSYAQRRRENRRSTGAGS